MKRLMISLLLALLFCSANVFAQLSGDRLKAVFVLTLMKGVEWENDEALTTYRLGVLDDYSMERELNELAKTFAVNGKKVAIVPFAQIDDIKGVNAVFISERKNADIDDIRAKVGSDGVLLITDGLSSYDKIMVNLLDMSSNKKYEVNRGNVEAAGLKVKAGLLVHGGKEKDLRSVYYDSKKQLEQEQQLLEQAQKKVAESAKQIKKHEKEIAAQETEIKAQQKEIEKRNEELEVQKQQIKAKEEALSKLNFDIAAQQDALLEKTKVLEEQEQNIKNQIDKIAAQEARIMDNDRTIAEKEKQRAKLEQTVEVQTVELVQKDDTIKNTKRTLYISLGVIALFVFLVVLVFLSYRAKKRINKELEQKNESIRQLSEFGQQVTATLDLENIAALTYGFVDRFMDTSAFGIGIYKEKRGLLHFPHFMSSGEQLKPLQVDMSNTQSLLVWAVQNNKVVRIADFDQDYRAFIDGEPYHITEDMPESAIYLPLFVKNKPAGVITLQSFTKHAYSDSDFNMLQTLASYVSIALDNAAAYDIVSAQNENIKGSINYAQTIQNAMLPKGEAIGEKYENFILFRPKDIVSGDFYWHTQVNDGRVLDFFAVVDCTGHGVPGAFMSMIGSRLLNEIVKERRIYDPATILEELNKGVLISLRQEETKNADGMDVALTLVEKLPQGETKVQFAGAKCDLFYSEDGEHINILKGDRKLIGGVFAQMEEQFTTQELVFKGAASLFMTSDGYIDQNNAQRKRFGSKRLVKILEANLSKPMAAIGQVVANSLDDYQKDENQRDDITMMGLRV